MASMMPVLRADDQDEQPDVDDRDYSQRELDDIYDQYPIER